MLLLRRTGISTIQQSTIADKEVGKKRKVGAIRRRESNAICIWNKKVRDHTRRKRWRTIQIHGAAHEKMA